MLGDCYWLKLTVTVTRNGNDRLSMSGLDHLRIAAITEAADIISTMQHIDVIANQRIAI